MAAWVDRCAAWGWACGPVLAPAECTDDPEALARDASACRSLCLGIPHPQFGVMRATLHLTAAASLVALAALAADAGVVEAEPRLFVGARLFSDVIAGRPCGVVGVVVAASADSRAHLAPLTVAAWRDFRLPFFEVEDWVMTGWDSRGRLAHIFKPFGWGRALLPVPGAEGAELASSRAGVRAREESVGSS